jgi:hypothetical protein
LCAGEVKSGVRGRRSAALIGRIPLDSFVPRPLKRKTMERTAASAGLNEYNQDLNILFLEQKVTYAQYHGRLIWTPYVGG